MRPEPIHAQLIGGNSCSAFGITISSPSPVLALCRKLVADGYDPSLPLEAYRGEMLALRVRSIGEAARLQVRSHGGGFEPLQERSAASPMSQIQEAAA
jgi:hypothetical protein